MHLSHNLIFIFPKGVRLDSTYYLIMNIQNKRELQNVATNHSADIDYKDLQKMYKTTIFLFDF